MLNQRTIAKKVSVTGIGIHSGKKVNMVLHPAEADSGIKFKRTDIPGASVLDATATTVGATENNTTIGSGQNAVHTVEHLLSVLYGLGINNCFIEIDGPEVPTMDGSGASFVFVLKETGIQTLNKSKKFLVVLKPVEVKVGEKWARIEPAEKLIIDSTIVFAHPLIKTQKKTFEFSCENYIREIGFALAYQRFLWKGLYAGVHVMSAWQSFINEEEKKIGEKGFMKIQVSVSKFYQITP